MRATLLPFAALLLTATLVSPVLAAWPDDPATNVPLCTAAFRQQLPMIASDGAGGAIVTWFDQRSGDNNIYAQRVLSSGAMDPAWPTNGRALCTAASNQSNPVIVSDGSGGALVAWYDRRSGASYDIYAQHVLGSGAVDPTWPIDGAVVCGAANDQFLPTIVSDGADGAIVTWYDFRDGDADIYSQRVLASGFVDPVWPADGQALCRAAGNQSQPMTVSDGIGGAITTWGDLRSGTKSDIYAQRVLNSGIVDPEWPPDGRAVCDAPNDRSGPTITSDGAGGAIISWYDNRDLGNIDIYAQHVHDNGKIDSEWPEGGQLLCGAADGQAYPEIVSDGASGAIVTWHDYRSATNYDVYAQHVLGSGVVDPAWPADGMTVCGAGGDQMNPKIMPHEDGGAIITWYDSRGGGSFDIYAQRVLPSGVAEPSWPVDGQTLSTAANNQALPAIVSNGEGGAIIAWQDSRFGTNYDIYVQGVDRYGDLGEPVLAVEPGAMSRGLSFAAPSPNPTRGAIRLRFVLPRAAQVRLSVYDAAGRRVRELINGSRAAGTHEESWNLRGTGERSVSAGFYFARLETEGQTLVRGITVTR